MKPVITYEIQKLKVDHPIVSIFDEVIAEEPLEINIQNTLGNTKSETFLVTMRTPGEDYELCLGILFSHGIIHHKKDVLFFKYLIADAHKTQVLIGLNTKEKISKKTSYTNSSCGICNSETWEDILHHSNYPILDSTFRIPADLITQCFHAITNEDDHFHKTGGNHKICLINEKGEMKLSAEDVGRHNAFDKILGLAIISEMMPLSNTIAVLSGRCSFEMCQKAWLAGIPIIASLGAPTSKAIEMAEDAGITLIGFLKADGFNIYSHPFRIENNNS